MNKRPSGANCIAVGLDKPLATRISKKPAGRVAAMEDDGNAAMNANRKQTSLTMTRPEKFMPLA
jgi:hypothetical protein